MPDPLRRRSGERDVSLDELLSPSQSPPHPLLLRRERSGLLTALFLASVAALAAYAFLRPFDVVVPFPVLLAAAVAFVLLRHALRSVVEPTWLRPADLVAPPRVQRWREPGTWYEGGDGMVVAVRRWDRALEWGDTHPTRFATTTAPRLRELVDERLRQRHGVTVSSDPARARALLGERLWALVGHPGQLATQRQLNAALDDLERL